MYPQAIELTDETIGRLLGQFPGLPERGWVRVAEGWDNQVVRVGEDHVARFPKHVQADALLANEIAWCEQATQHLSIRVSRPIFAGRAVDEYPFRWALYEWIEGRDLFSCPVDSERLISSLAGVFTELHQPAPSSAPINPYRGVPLSTRSAILRQGLRRCAGLVDFDRAIAAFEADASAAPYDATPLWLHGDPHPLNLIGRDGDLVGVVDWGDITCGDPASDLGAAYLIFDGPMAEQFLGTLDYVDDSMRRRARAWGLCYTVAFLGGEDRVRGIGLRAMSRSFPSLRGDSLLA